MTVADLLLIVAAMLAGAFGGYLRSWTLNSRVYSLEDTVSVLQGSLIREVKARAAAERWKKKDVLEHSLVDQITQPKEESKPQPTFWWQKYVKEPPKAESH